MQRFITFVAMLMSAVVASFFVAPWWTYWAVADRVFSGSPVWWSTPHALLVVDDIFITLVAGIAFGLLASPRRPWLWGLALGVLFSLIQLSLSRNWVNPEADIVDLFWAYSQYYLSPIGAVLGTLAGGRLRAARDGRVVA